MYTIYRDSATSVWGTAMFISNKIHSLTFKPEDHDHSNICDYKPCIILSQINTNTAQRFFCFFVF